MKNLPTNAGGGGSIPGLGRSPGERNGNPLQYSCLGNPMDRGAWWSTVHGVTKSWTQLSGSRTTTTTTNVYICKGKSSFCKGVSPCYRGEEDDHISATSYQGKGNELNIITTLPFFTGLFLVTSGTDSPHTQHPFLSLVEDGI